MAGVAGPMLQRDKAQGSRFFLGLLTGGLAASAVLAMLVYAVGTPISSLAPLRYRAVLAALVIAGFGIADLAGRTPHVWRQVPQRFVRTLPPGRLGLVWGFDLSLLVTTQKTTSLAWAALTGLLLLAPSAALPALLAMTLAGTAAVAVRSGTWGRRTGTSALGDRRRPWFMPMRRSAGIALLLLAALIAL
jgi:hypothetical protein